MRSWQLLLLNAVSRCVVKPFVRRSSAKTTPGRETETIDKMRRWVVRLDRALISKKPAPVSVDPVAGQPSYLWVNNKSEVRRTILYLHGGGMIIHVPGLYKQWAQRLATAANARVLLVDYRLAPEHPYPASGDDCFAAYQWLVSENGIDPADIIIAGDSAGGYLTLATLLRIGRSELGNPCCAIALSPLSDFSLGSPAMFTNEGADPLLSNRLIPVVRQLVLGEHLCTEPDVSPVYADLSEFPPLQVHVSSNEILRDDGVRIVNRARSQGATAELCEWYKTTHVHPLFEWLPESNDALAEMLKFMDRYQQADDSKTANRPSPV
uniref:Alpha/beta hydrolase fold-3 domain-containing protein n=1 Tax=uncultured organism TaxID=155900 RepID=A0A0G3FEI8_9ZZZZ|nr:hypothetical protein [uncultured organism]